VADIARAFGRRNKSGVYRILALDGGIAPIPRGFAIPRVVRMVLDHSTCDLPRQQ
jgi:hypothetical protein